jgi:hypothetical protein
MLTLPFLAALPGTAIGSENEVLYKICFSEPPPVSEKSTECMDEDCGLQDEWSPDPPPSVKKTQNYTVLGATDLGMIWGADNYRPIGDQRVRALLYVIPSITAKTAVYEKQVLVPEAAVQSLFFSLFGQLTGTSTTMVYKVRTQTVEKKEITGGDPLLLMVDLHCTARKLKIYDNHSLFYRMSEQQQGEQHCVELVWEKPSNPLPWQPASSLTIDILAGFYCNHRNGSSR